jgi:hypothetical protein
VLGEGTFLTLFLHEHAPDPITADMMRLADVTGRGCGNTRMR